jgi:hypothetical protein
VRSRRRILAQVNLRIDDEQPSSGQTRRIAQIQASNVFDFVADPCDLADDTGHVTFQLKKIKKNLAEHLHIICHSASFPAYALLQPTTAPE